MQLCVVLRTFARAMYVLLCPSTPPAHHQVRLCCPKNPSTLKLYYRATAVINTGVAQTMWSVCVTSVVGSRAAFARLCLHANYLGTSQHAYSVHPVDPALYNTMTRKDLFRILILFLHFETHNAPLRKKPGTDMKDSENGKAK